MVGKTAHGRGASKHIVGSWPLEPSRASFSGAAEDPMPVAAEQIRGKVFEGVLAFSNIGLAGKAVNSESSWPKHRRRLHVLVSDLFTAATERGRVLWGILLNEVGNMSELLDHCGRQNFDGMLRDGFRQSCGEEPQLYWSKGETMAAFRPAVTVERLPSLVRMTRVDPWRTVERFALFGATEHGPCTLLVFNQHQPKSSTRPF